MKIKSYYARSVEEAVAQARAELGEDAMLVNSRKAPPESRHLGEYEVVFATAPPAAPSAPPASEPRISEPGALPDRLSREVADLRRQLESMRRTLTRSPLVSAPVWPGQAPEISDIYALLTANEISPDLARDLVQAVEARAGARPASLRTPRREIPDYRTALVDEMQSRVEVQASLGRGQGRPAIVALVGPPGAGKTSTLVKLAVNYGLTARRPVVLVSTDTYRVAAAEQLRGFAAILGVGFQVVETAGALAQNLEENRGKDLILIDTPGLGFSEMDHAADLARFLATRSDIDTQLVLPASMKPADLTRVIDAYEIFHPQRLLFSRLDETGSFGPIFNEVVRTGKALSFFSTGQRIPEDLETASRERLVELTLGGRPERAASAA